LDQLHKRFVDTNFHVQELLVQISMVIVNHELDQIKE